MEQMAVVLPSLNPDEKLMRVVNKLAEAGFGGIVIVNDGSDENRLAPFAEAALLPQCTVLRHEVNKGKGRALKTGFAYIAEHCPGIRGVITVDGDDQHQIQDIVACGLALKEHPGCLVLGVRDFSRQDGAEGAAIPWRSRWGNNITAFVFKSVCGIKVTDTQTGLRALSRQYLAEFCHIEGERFEYETKMLLETKRLGIPFYEVKISAVYIDENSSSHFRALKDSLKIYGVIFRFALSSFASAVVDIGAFTLLNIMLGGFAPERRLLAATVFARLVSALFNYTFNRKVVFRSRASRQKTLVRYLLLCGVQMAASYCIVLALSALLPGGPLWDSAFKIAVDLFLFFLSFRIQQRWIFQEESPRTGLPDR